MRILLFDIDGTLLLTNGGQHALEMALTSEFGIESPFVDISYGGRTDL
jgi:phosphoglycolate phosphatase-like HAD superfamily hydrolase